MADFSPLNTIKQMASGAATPPVPAMLGRFQLRRKLGQGAQSLVWLAFDPRLEREVAIKLMKMGRRVDADAIARWLQEARSVSRLTHPNIVPLFEADVQDQQPYLVFEYVPGQTLADVLAKRGALAPLEAVALMLEVLDALAVAHAAGVVHRDLKPSNIMIDAAGRARVMDFGIAARIKQSAGTTAITADGGTPAYMAPETAQGGAATPAVDIFSAGLVLAEMLLGKPLVAETDSYRAIYRISHEQMALPANLAAEVDDALRAMVLRALALEPSQRHASAKIFHDELAKWSAAMAPAAGQASVGDVGSHGNGTIEFLLRRMRHKTDFPTLSDSVVRIQRMASSEKESINSITNEILKDVALTNKLLRLVNSAHYARGSSISTISRAVGLVGLNGIRNMALSLVLLEHMQDKAQAQQLKEEFLRSLMAGAVAGELCTVAKDSEEAFIGSMFHNLGRLLAKYYFPEEAVSIEALTRSTGQPVSEAAASTSVLGLSYEDLGTGVAKAWGLPEGIQRCMRQQLGEPPVRVPTELSERLQWTALAANEISEVLLHADPSEKDARLAQVAKRYARIIGSSPGQVQAATIVARGKLVDMASAMNLKVLPGSSAARLLRDPEEKLGTVRVDTSDPSDSLLPLELQATATRGNVDASEPLPDSVPSVFQTLSAGIQDITNTMVEDFNLSDVLRMILETMYRAMGFHRIIFCLRDPKTDNLTGRFGLGEGVERIVKLFHVAFKANPSDLFSVVCSKGADTLISDSNEARIASRLPLWYRESIDAPTFLLLPVHLKGRPIGLIYADKAEPGGLSLDEKELALLRTLRNQAVMAFKQSS